jgi:NAD(P)-dependent dehydrogenase (short-subunit alcohol dehydrogenase family)
MNSFKDKVAMVTGASGNLGQAVAQALRAAGARCALVDHAKGRLEKRFGSASGDLLLLEGVNLAEPAQAEAAISATVKQFGRIDILINTVGGYAGGQRVHEDELVNWEKMFRINLHTTLHACRAAVPHMLRQGSGRVVNVAARAALTGVATLGAYSASKSAVIRLTESLAGELKDHGITVNCVLPGTIDTPQNRKDMPNADFSKWVAPAAIADAMLFLASDAARAVTGAALPVYGRS